MPQSTRTFSFELPLQYEHWLATGMALSLLRDTPHLGFPSVDQSEDITYEQEFPHAPDRDAGPQTAAAAQMAETLLRKLWERGERGDLGVPFKTLKHSLSVARNPDANAPPAFSLPTVRITAREHGSLDAAIALLQACQQECGLPATGFAFYDDDGEGLRNGGAVVVAPDKHPMVFSLDIWLKQQLETLADALPRPGAAAEPPGPEPAP